MRRLLFVLVFTGWVMAGLSQKIEEAFINMPDEMIIQLEEAWRKGLVDLYKSGKSATLDNMMLGKSTMKHLTDDYLLLQLTKYSTVEMKLLPLVNNTFIICMITTVSAPVADSHVSFYTTEWQPLPAAQLYDPVTEEWFWKEDVDRSSHQFMDARALLNIFLFKYSLSPDAPTLTCEYMTPAWLDEESRAKVMPLLKESPKKYEWKLNRFE